MTKTYMMHNLCEKMQSPDQDFRFMALNDLMLEIKNDPNNFNGDEAVESKVLQGVLKLVEDTISEVKNQAVKCLGQLIKIVKESQMEYIIDRLIEYSTGNDEELRDIAGLALKTITAELPKDGKLATKACAKLAPKLLEQLQNSATPPDTTIETLGILTILVARFPNELSDTSIDPQPLAVLLPLLNHSRPAVRKRAITTLAQFLPPAPPEAFAEILNANILPALSNDVPLDARRTVATLVASIARFSPQRIAPAIPQIVPGLLQAAAQEDEELRENVLQALESLVLRCPSEIPSSLNDILSLSARLIKYDPNYAGDDDDEDDEMVDGDEDEDDEENLDDEYSDDEDTSYKIRRSATKVLSAIIGTRPELLITLYRNVSPILISRFGDREDTVKLEIWSTFVLLLNQTGVYGGIIQARDMTEAASLKGSSKRKRESSETAAVEETPFSLLRSQVPELTKALFGQIKSPKTPTPTLQAAFALLRTLLTILPGSLSAQTGQIFNFSKTILSQTSTSATAALHTTVLSMLGLFLGTHPPDIYNASLPAILPALLSKLAEKHPRVASEGFSAISSLLNAQKPVPDTAFVTAVHEALLRRLQSADTDSEVRERVEECVANLWVCAPDVVSPLGGKEWELVRRMTGRTDVAVRAVTKVAGLVQSLDEQWISASIEWTLGVLRKSGRTGKVDVFTCLDALLKSYKSALPEGLPQHLISNLTAYINTEDIGLASQALTTLTVLLQVSPSTYQQIERDILKDVYPFACSSLLAGSSLEAVLTFFRVLVEADVQIATHVIPGLSIALDKAPKGEAAPENVAKCVGRVVMSHMGVAAGTIAEYAKYIKVSGKAKENQVILSLLVLGELGRFIDMSPQSEVFQGALDLFTSDSEEIRTAAAFAVGNMAIGNPGAFLPVIVRLMQTDSEKRLLALRALKEVVTHCSHAQLEPVADALWAPLFDNSQNSEEATRNVAAACIGKLATTHPSRYLPALQASITDADPSRRALVISAIRYTLVDASGPYDELLSGSIINFLSLMTDQDLNVRRLTLQALNAAARNKPTLIQPHLASIMSQLYQETTVRTELIRTVQMGPWTQKFDDGLEARKTAYETLYTLLDTCLSKIDLPAFLTQVLSGLVDDADEIKVLCYMMLFRLSQVAGTTVAQRLDEATPELEKAMKGAAVTKDTVKQDLERNAELQRSALRAIAGLSKVSNSGTSPRFDAFAADIQRDPKWATEFKEIAAQA